MLLLENEKRLLLSRLDSSSTAAGATQDAQDAGALQKSLVVAREELSVQKRAAQALQQQLLRVRTQTEDEARTLQSRYAAMKQALEAQVRGSLWTQIWFQWSGQTIFWTYSRDLHPN